MRIRSLLLSSACALGPTIMFAAPVSAQSVTLAPPPIRLPVDEHGVNLATGDVVVPSASVSIGGENGLTHTRYRVANGWRHNYLISAQIASGATTASVNIGGARQTFTWNGTVYVADQGTGETIAANFTTGEHILTARDGTRIIFKAQYVTAGQSYYGAADALGEKIIRPDGHETTLHYTSSYYEQYIESAGYWLSVYVVRLSSVTNSSGYQLLFDYSSGNPQNADDWYDISKVTAINRVEEACGTGGGCTLTKVWPSLTYSKSNSGSDTLETVTDVLGRSSRYRTDGSRRLTGLKRPSEANEGIIYSYGSDGKVESVQYQGEYTRNYTWGFLSSYLTSNSNDTLGRFRATAADPSQQNLVYINDANNNQSSFTYDANGRLRSVEPPGGTRLEYTYDVRGNVTEVRRKAKPASGLADIVSTTVYATTCSNPVTCNKPVSATDPEGNTVNYTWDPVHGGLLQSQLPAPVPGGPRTTTIIQYASRQARFKNESGALIDGVAMVVPTMSSTCRTAASCVGTANEQRTIISYTTTGAHNLNPSQVAAASGNGVISLTTNFTYTGRGEIATLDGPLVGTGDTTTYRYDNAGQVVGVIGPDPDGAGALPHLATRMTYNTDGQVTLTENGQVAGTSSADWTNFAVNTVAQNTYDNFGRIRATAQISTDGATRYSIAQYGYDYAGRLECTAVRMNLTSAATPLPANACVKMTPGSFGEDRITKRIYDTSDRLVEVWSGVDTLLAQQSAQLSYNPNGSVAWVEDANNNRTTYSYDGHNRQWRIEYPNPNLAGASNAADREELTFDRNGNVLSFLTRRGETFNFTYDELGRMTRKDVPTRVGLNTTHTRDVFYEYNLAGSLLAARFDSATGSDRVTFAYDGLGRPTSTSQVLNGTTRTLSYLYDTAGRLSRVTYPDAAWWGYEYDTAGRLARVRDDDGFELTNNVFDAFGRVERMNRDSSAPDTSFFYDAASRLNRIFIDHQSASYDVNRNYAHNPANQATNEQVDNQLYVWNAQPSGSLDTPYVPDGLNQYDNVNNVTYAHDTNGNLSSDGATTYTYDTENRLVGAAGANTANLRYDPLGRLYEITNGVGAITRLLYNRDALVAEYNSSGTMLNRYVHGLGAGDDPTIRYAGSNAGRITAEYLYADRLGSIVASFDWAGSVKAINTYDEFGVPGTLAETANTGRFRYTGQIWIPELGQYHYKARAYSPTLGRFMQVDPIGYSDGMNIYKYVGNDPINSIDPLGLSQTKMCTGSRIQRDLDYDCGDLYSGTGPLTDTTPNFSATLTSGRSIGFSSGGLGIYPVTRTVCVGDNCRTTNMFPQISRAPAAHVTPTIRVFSQCSADAFFRAFLREGGSAPGASEITEEGVRQVDLFGIFGPNPIQQTTDFSDRTILNETLDGHFFDGPSGGFVRIRVTSVGGLNARSMVTITGAGSNSSQSNAVLNTVFGYLFFQSAALDASTSC